jgi:hypothetical protein
MQHATVIPECMHRFCQTCIEDAIRLGKKECPNCRVKCTSRRSLRPDTFFDELIHLVYPDLNKEIAKHVIKLTRSRRMMPLCMI